MWEHQTSWCDRAAAAGFADQAHMNREFKHFAGITPTEYRPMAGAAPNHVGPVDVRNIQDGSHVSRQSRAERLRGSCQ
jgi:AraC-like DNA-binding protein